MSVPARQLTRVLTEQIRQGPLAHERVLEVLPALQGILPAGGLRRGTVAAISGGAATSFALALAAGPTASGAWAAIVGLPTVGVAAAVELGVALERVFLVAPPPAKQWAEVMAAAADGAELLIAASPVSVRPAEIRRVQARLQARGAVLVLVGEAAAWGPEVRCTVTPLAWDGIGDGHGRLVARRVVVDLDGRRAGRPVRREYWLPGVDGGVTEVVAPAIPLRAPVAG